MADRVLGQLSLADGLVASDKTIFDLVSKELDWAPIRTLLDHRSGPGSNVDALRVDRIREELEYGGLRLRT